ncbi:ImmA/IrrE family metallo-endopeptidase [Pseudactinotalea sp. HY158]|uniref:ImmA/IrrE family metallo-endopeptidase n=1 Tax=Pseudactinotalea sp. HY158 TaxID=2654547 RepID=UPI00189215B7|nr:ImmA/IrrE family metallo-endopeptidase [Pseudactinotalea sp. HY158]
MYGLTQAELGARIGVAQGHLSKLERGTAPLSMASALAASEAFGEPLSFFKIPSNPVPLGPTAYRRKASMKAAERDRVASFYREAARIFAAVSEASGYHEFTLVEAIDRTTPERAAEAVRVLAGLSPAAPVRNVVRLVERLGIGVVTDLDDPEHACDPMDLSGITMPTAQNRRPLIATAPIARGDAQRMTLAHEFAHLVLDREAASISCATRSPQERRAFRFARALLLPSAVLLDRIDERSTFRDYLELKAEYGVSVGSTIMGARELGAITPQRARILQIQLNSRGWRTAEPVEVVAERPALFRQALQRAYPTSPIPRASTSLGVAPKRLRRWMGDTESGAGDDIAPVVPLRARSKLRWA